MLIFVKILSSKYNIHCYYWVISVLLYLVIHFSLFWKKLKLCVISRTTKSLHRILPIKIDLTPTLHFCQANLSSKLFFFAKWRWFAICNSRHKVVIYFEHITYHKWFLTAHVVYWRGLTVHCFSKSASNNSLTLNDLLTLYNFCLIQTIFVMNITVFKEWD